MQAYDSLIFLINVLCNLLLYVCVLYIYYAPPLG